MKKTSNFTFNFVYLKLLIIDSRNVNEYNVLHIRNSINIPYSKIIRKRLMTDKVSVFFH